MNVGELVVINQGDRGLCTNNHGKWYFPDKFQFKNAEVGFCHVTEVTKDMEKWGAFNGEMIKGTKMNISGVNLSSGESLWYTGNYKGTEFLLTEDSYHDFLYVTDENGRVLCGDGKRTEFMYMFEKYKDKETSYEVLKFFLKHKVGSNWKKPENFNRDKALADLIASYNQRYSINETLDIYVFNWSFFAVVSNARAVFYPISKDTWAPNSGLSLPVDMVKMLKEDKDENLDVEMFVPTMFIQFMRGLGMSPFTGYYSSVKYEMEGVVSQSFDFMGRDFKGYRFELSSEAFEVAITGRDIKDDEENEELLKCKNAWDIVNKSYGEAVAWFKSLGKYVSGNSAIEQYRDLRGRLEKFYCTPIVLNK